MKEMQEEIARLKQHAQQQALNDGKIFHSPSYLLSFCVFLMMLTHGNYLQFYRRIQSQRRRRKAT